LSDVLIRCFESERSAGKGTRNVSIPGAPAVAARVALVEVFAGTGAGFAFHDRLLRGFLPEQFLPFQPQEKRGFEPRHAQFLASEVAVKKHQAKGELAGTSLIEVFSPNEVTRSFTRPKKESVGTNKKS